jgi:hypothetical protein
VRKGAVEPDARRRLPRTTPPARNREWIPVDAGVASWRESGRLYSPDAASVCRPNPRTFGVDSARATGAVYEGRPRSALVLLQSGDPYDSVVASPAEGAAPIAGLRRPPNSPQQWLRSHLDEGGNGAPPVTQRRRERKNSDSDH